MRPISYARPADVAGAVEAVSADPLSDYLAGGTTEIDLLRQHVLTPRRLVDINRLPLTGVEELPGGLRVGALTRMSDLAAHPLVRSRLPMLASALEQGASPQLRHMASIGGNLLQRTRCSYFRDGVSACNKREPHSGCAALRGVSRGHAVLGTSEHCIAAHPSDLAVPLVALDARVHTRTALGERVHAIADFFLPPGDTPQAEHPLEHGELITAVEIPETPMARSSVYLKVRDRASYEFALASVAACVTLDGATVTGVRLALGGVGTVPWRAHRAESALLGVVASRQSFLHAAREELAGARTTPMNAFKAELAQRVIVRALQMLTFPQAPDGLGGTPTPGSPA